MDKREEAQIPTLISNQPRVPSPEPTVVSSKLIMGVGGKKKVLKALKLSEITKPLSTQERQKQMINALKRILQSDEQLTDVKCKLVASILITGSFPIRSFVMMYIKEDIRHRLDLGIHWLFGEYSLCQCYLNMALPTIADSSQDR